MDNLNTLTINSTYILSSIYSFNKNKFLLDRTLFKPYPENLQLNTLDKKNENLQKNLSGFLDFLKVFSEIFHNNYYHLNSLVQEFKNNNSGLKEVYAELISDKYKEFISEISMIKSPEFVNPLIKTYLSVLKKWHMYYCLYNDVANNDEILFLIDNEAAILEQRFWRRFNKINNFFKCKIANF